MSVLFRRNNKYNIRNSLMTFYYVTRMQRILIALTLWPSVRPSQAKTAERIKLGLGT